MLYIAPVQFSKYLAQLAEMRIQVFREYPYLYEGSLEYEFDYLDRYAKCPSAVLLALLDREGAAHGFCTGIPLEFEDPELASPVPGDHSHSFYIGEILLSPQARAQGWGALLLEQMIITSQAKGFVRHLLYTVVEPREHRPTPYHSPASLWRKMGFALTGIQAEFAWKRWDQQSAQNHRMDLWIRILPQ